MPPPNPAFTPADSYEATTSSPSLSLEQADSLTPCGSAASQQETVGFHRLHHSCSEMDAPESLVHCGASVPVWTVIAWARQRVRAQPQRDLLQPAAEPSRLQNDQAENLVVSVFLVAVSARTHRESSAQPPPTRTITVRLRRIRQKHSLARPSAPIQYLPDSSCQSSPAGAMGMSTCRMSNLARTSTVNSLLIDSQSCRQLHLACSSGWKRTPWAHWACLLHSRAAG